MAIEFRCPTCDQQLRVPDDSAGKSAKCPKCAAIVQIPATGFSAGASAFPPGPGQPPPAQPMPPMGSFADPGKPLGASPFGAGAPVNPYASSQSTFEQPGAGFAQSGDVGHQVVTIEPIMNYAMKVWQNNLGLLVGTTAIVLGISIAISAVQGGLQAVCEANDMPEAAVGVVVFFNIFSNLVQAFLGIGQALIALKLVRGQPAVVADLFNGGERFLPVLGVSILGGLAVTLGFLLCIVPGAILLLYYWPCYYLVIDKKARVMDSFGIAGRVTEGNRMTSFLVWLLGVGVSILGCLACGVGILFAAPFVTVLVATAYLMMSGQLSTQPVYK